MIKYDRNEMLSQITININIINMHPQNYNEIHFQIGNFDALILYESTEVDRKTFLHVSPGTYAPPAVTQAQLTAFPENLSSHDAPQSGPVS